MSAGSDVVFTIAATASGTLTVTWQQSADSGQTWSTAGSTGVTLTLASVVAGDSGRQVRAQVCNVVGSEQTCIQSNAAVLTVTVSVAFPASAVPFAAFDLTRGQELWMTDGTEAGTVLVKDIRPGTASSGVQSITRAGDLVYFTADDGVHGRELWRTDGTDTGTAMVIDLNPGLPQGYPIRLTACNGRLFFGGRDAVGLAAWVTNGTAAGTVRLAAAALDDNPGTALCVNGVFYFNARTSASGRELWRSDGTPAGTSLVLDIAPGTSDSTPSEFTVFQDRLHFKASGRLWRSDGTPTGTVQVSSSASDPAWMIVHGSTLYFSSQGPFGREPWKSDGTDAGTVMIKNINASLDSYPYKFTVSNGIVYFGAEQFSGSQQLWRTDGTEAGTYMVKQITPGSVATFGDSMVDVNGTLFFSATDAAYGSELWKSDGTSAGTVLVRDLNPGTNGSNPTNFRRLGDVLLFSTGVIGFGTELWRSDGTQAGTVLVKDICAGPDCSGAPVFRP